MMIKVTQYFQELKSKVKNNLPVVIKKQLPVNIGVELTVKNSDTFVASYPRSGNTWMRFLIGTLVFSQKITWKNVEHFVPAMYAHSDKELLGAPSPRFIKTHHPFNSKFPRAIYLIRDVRDVVISYYNWHLKMKEGFNENFDCFFYKFLNGELGDNYGSWGENVKSWLSNKEKLRKGCLVLKYEDLNEDTEGELRKVLRFLDIDRSNKQIREAIEWCSFENMKRLEEKQKHEVERFKNSKQEKNFVRKGVSGQWQEELNDSHIRAVNEKFGSLLTRLGYENN